MNKKEFYNSVIKAYPQYQWDKDSIYGEPWCSANPSIKCYCDYCEEKNCEIEGCKCDNCENNSTMFFMDSFSTVIKDVGIDITYNEKEINKAKTWCVGTLNISGNEKEPFELVLTHVDNDLRGDVDKFLDGYKSKEEAQKDFDNFLSLIGAGELS